MTIITLLLIINYIVAVMALIRLSNDEFWSVILTYLMMDKDANERDMLYEHQNMLRHITCMLLLIPSVGLVVLYLTFKHKQ